MTETPKEPTEHVYTSTAGALFRTVSFVLVLSVIAATVLLAFYYKHLTPATTGILGRRVEFTTFKNSKEFSDYFASSQKELANFYSSGGALDTSMAVREEGVAVPTPINADRFSETNVQVKGIDEPDIVKTDGNNIYLSQENFYYPLIRGGGFGAVSIDIAPSPETEGGTRIVSTRPELAKIGEIERGGDLFTTGNRIIVLSRDGVYGYDKQATTTEKWRYTLENNQIVTSRLTNGKLYLLIQSYANGPSPCPIPLLTPANSSSITIACTDIYYPNVTIPVDSTYSLVKIEPESGEIEDTVSFVGAAGGGQVTYMSPEAFYVAYPYQEDIASIFTDFLLSDGADLLPVSTVTRIQEISTYNISSGSKYAEIQLAIQSHRNSLSKDEALAFDQQLTNKQNDYVSRKKRELDKTAIVKISLNKMAAEETTSIAGKPLNQFAMDEHEGHLRVATTVGNTFLARVDTVSDIYVLDNNLDVVGSVTDLAAGERIYSVRFIGDLGYVVTFKEIDPFFVIELSDARNPRVVGELKIPGYSSYLHPIDNTHILGVGKEGEQVKLSLFDVSIPTDPQEVSKYLLNEYWSEALFNHHAFLQDDRHEVFFIPGTNGGYIVNYGEGSLSLEKAVSMTGVLRALFVGDTLYIISRDAIRSYDESTWEQVQELTL